MMTRITGTGSALPKEVVSNDKIAQWVDAKAQWIQERTGIESRRMSAGETVASLAAKACREALIMAGREAEEIDLILLATCSPEYLLPCSACQVQQQLGAVNAVAFDINAACSGFVFGLITANAYIQSGMYRKILVIGSEVLSKIMDWTDRSTCILFGDGAGAVLLEAVEEVEKDGQAAEKISLPSGIIASVQGSDGAKGMALSCRERGLKNPCVEEALEEPEPLYVQMDGQAVYRFATRTVPECISEVLRRASLSVEDIDLFILHQANVRIIEAVAKRLHAEGSKFPLNIDRVGNMSSASIPVLLDELNRKGALKKGDKLVLSGFGAGLTYGACVLVW